MVEFRGFHLVHPSCSGKKLLRNLLFLSLKVNKLKAAIHFSPQMVSISVPQWHHPLWESNFCLWVFFLTRTLYIFLDRSAKIMCLRVGNGILYFHCNTSRKVISPSSLGVINLMVDIFYLFFKCV